MAPYAHAWPCLDHAGPPVWLAVNHAAALEAVADAAQETLLVPGLVNSERAYAAGEEGCADTLTCLRAVRPPLEEELEGDLTRLMFTFEGRLVRAIARVDRLDAISGEGQQRDVDEDQGLDGRDPPFLVHGFVTSTVAWRSAACSSAIRTTP